MQSHFPLPCGGGSVNFCFASSVCGCETVIKGVNAFTPTAKAFSSDPRGRKPPLSSVASLVVDGECKLPPGLLAEDGVDGVCALDAAALV